MRPRVLVIQVWERPPRPPSGRRPLPDCGAATPSPPPGAGAPAVQAAASPQPQCPPTGPSCSRRPRAPRPSALHVPRPGSRVCWEDPGPRAAAGPRQPRLRPPAQCPLHRAPMLNTCRLGQAGTRQGARGSAVQRKLPTARVGADPGSYSSVLQDWPLLSTGVPNFATNQCFPQPPPPTQ